MALASRAALACVIAGVGLVAYFSLRPTPVARVGPKPTPGGKTVVLLHGHGAPANDLESLAERLLPDAPETTFLMPAGPHSAGGDGRTWIPSFTAPSRAEYVSQLATAVEPVVAGVWSVIESARRRGVDCGQIWVGGFSLGGRMAIEVALRAPADCHLAGVAILSGGGAQELELPSGSGDPLRILVTHGRSDGVVPFSQGEAFARKLALAGHEVRWFAFDGGHQLAPVVEAMSRFLRGEEVGVNGGTL